MGLIRRLARAAACAAWLALPCAPLCAAPTLSEQWDAREEERLQGFYQHPEGQARRLLALKRDAQAGGHDAAYWTALGQLARIAGHAPNLDIDALDAEAQRELPRARAAQDALSTASLLMGLLNIGLLNLKIPAALQVAREAVALGESQHIPGLINDAQFLEAELLAVSGRQAQGLALAQRLQYTVKRPVARWSAELSRLLSDASISSTSTDLPRLTPKFEELAKRIDTDRAFFLVVSTQRHLGRLLVRQKRAPEALAALEAWQRLARQRGQDLAESDFFVRWARQLYRDTGMWQDCLRVTPVPTPQMGVWRQFQSLDTRLTCRSKLKDPWVREDVRRLEALVPQLSDAPVLLEQAYTALELAYVGVGDFEKGYAAAQKTRELMSRRFAAANDMARHEAEAKYDLAAKEKETALLKASEQLQTQRRNALAAGLALTVLGLAILAVMLRRQTRQQRELSALSASLQASNDELRVLNASRTRLLAAACHDLRQPAHALGLLAETAVHQAGPQARPPLLAMKRCSSALSDMLDMLLDMTQLEADRYIPVRKAFALQELLQVLQAQFSPLALRKGLLLQLQETDAVVVSDPHLVRRMLMNLVSNAIKYTHEGGVSVAVQRSPGEPQLTVCVQDTGPGIPPEQLDQVFGEYVRLDASGAVEGLGIGLPIVKRAAELLGHELELTSQVGQGTRVTLQLPLAQGQTASEAEPPAVQGQGQRIGVVDDDANIREATAQLLLAHGFAVVTADSVHALASECQAAWASAPELVVTDLHLGADHNGLQDIQALRETPGWAGVSMLLVTGDLSPEVAGQAASLGVLLAYKPVPPRRLLRLAQQILQRQVLPGGATMQGAAGPS